MNIIPLRKQKPDMLDQLDRLYNTSSLNPAVIERQQRSEELTRFQIDHDPTYAAELARLRSYIGSYEIPTKEDV